MTFETAAAPHQITDTTWQAKLSRDWGQGRTIFGGLVGALLVNAMAPLAAPDQVLRSISLAFAAPITQDEATISTAVDRRGKSTTFTSATLVSGESFCTRASALFAADRESEFVVPGKPPALEKTFEDAIMLESGPGVPPFMTNFELKWGAGEFPFSGSDRGVVGGYCRHKEPASGVAAIVGLIDAWPPAILPIATKPIVSSTITWTAHIIDPRVVVADDWFEFRYETTAAGNGYGSYFGTLSKDGRDVAWTEQVGAIFG